MSRQIITSIININEYAFITHEEDTCNICGLTKKCLTFDNSNGENNACAICQDCTIKTFYKHAEIEEVKDK